MCFSSLASFSAAGFLSLASLFSFYYVRKMPSNYLLATIPLLFALQQFCEGLLWHYGPSSSMGYFAGYLFFYQAVALWPFWIPLSVFSAEINQKVKQRLLPFYVGGLIWLLIITGILLFYSLAIMLNTNINYTVLVPFQIPSAVILVYLLLVGGPFLVTTLHYAKLFAFFIVSSFVISYWYWYQAFGSVWCFFSAWLSILLVFMLYKNQNYFD